MRWKSLKVVSKGENGERKMEEEWWKNNGAEAHGLQKPQLTRYLIAGELSCTQADLDWRFTATLRTKKGVKDQERSQGPREEPRTKRKAKDQEKSHGTKEPSQEKIRSRRARS